MTKAQRMTKGQEFGPESIIDAKQLVTKPTATNQLEHWLLRRLLHFLGDPPITLVLWDGSSLSSQAGESGCRLVFKDRGAVYRLFANTGFEFGELYTAGRLEVEDEMAEFLNLVYKALNQTENPDGLRGRFAKLLSLRTRTKAYARDNISHHYDIGNDFYQMWLDQQMVYTCAYYSTAEATLEQAQTAKLDYVCRKLQLKPGQKVVEAGCGWGALALHMARHYGVEVKAYNISREQIAYAREQARSQGLDGQVEFIEDDSRHINGTFDAFVSIGMLEHIGLDSYPELGQLIGRVLKQGGRGMVHTIGRDRPGSMNTWIERRIFPGAHPPSLSEMMVLFEPNGLSVLDIENLRLHYAKTLEHWLQRFEGNRQEVAEMFDENFVRAWRLYLAGSLAAFESGSLQLFQVVFSRSGDNSISWTRDHLYQTSE